jgi:hypothetical protein
MKFGLKTSQKWCYTSCMIEFFQKFVLELFVGIVIYIVGVLTSKLWFKIKRNSNEKTLRKNVKTALRIIYSSEEKFPGRKRGIEKLEYAVDEFMKEVNIKDYESAQDYIIKVFNLTKLSKVDFF